MLQCLEANSLMMFSVHVVQGWRHLRLGGTKWRNLQQLPNNQSSLDAANATRGPTTPFSTEKELVAVGVGDDGEDEKAARPLLAAQDQELSEEKTDGDPGTACVLRASQQEIELRARQVRSTNEGVQVGMFNIDGFLPFSPSYTCLTYTHHSSASVHAGIPSKSYSAVSCGSGQANARWSDASLHSRLRCSASLILY